MNIEFHYWVTGLIAEYAGLPAADCRTIAHSSEYTDANNSMIEVFDDEFDVFPSYVSHVSQTEDITQPKDKVMKIYPLFHFLPGDRNAASSRIDSKTHPLLTTPDSSYANNVMQYTLQNAVSRYKSKDKSCLYRIGIAAHCYADTWAHQNFIGWFDDMNGIPKISFPNIGHFDAMHNPDLVHHTWKDSRLVNKDIDNNVRFLTAAQRLYEHFCGFNQQVSNQPPRGTWGQLNEFLTSVWNDESLAMKARIDGYRRHSKALKDYDDLAWEAGAFVRKNVHSPSGDWIEKCVWRTDVKKANTDWFKFQEAVKSHIADVSTILRPAFLEANIYI